MKKTKKIVYIALILIGMGLLPLIILRGWGSYQLWQTGRVKTPEGLNRWEETVRKATTFPAGENLLKRPLWSAYIRETISRTEDEGWKPRPPATNAFSVWSREQSSRKELYTRWRPDKEMPEPAPRFQGLIPLEKIREEAAKEIPDNSYQKEELIEKKRLLNEMLLRYDVADSSLTDEQKTAALLLDYINGVHKATREELRKDLEECNYYAFTKETFVESGGSKETPLPEVLLPHLAVFKGLCQNLSESAHWYAILGEREQSLSELNSALDLASLKTGSPLLMDGLVRVALVAITLDAVQKVIQNEVLQEEDLRQIQGRISQLNMIAELQHALEGEQLFGEAMIDALHMLPEGRGSMEYAKNRTPWSLRLGARMIGFIQLNKASYRQTFWLWQDALEPKTQTVNYEAWKKGAEGPKGFLYLLSRNLSLDLEKSCYRFFRCQSQKDITILACALERYRLKEGVYPEKLEALIPDYLEAMPPGSGPPATLSYQLSEEGEGYELKANRLPDLQSEFSLEATWKRSRE